MGVKRKQEEVPGLLSVVFGGFFAAFLGTMAAAVVLAIQPVVLVRPDDEQPPPPGRVPYLPGDETSPDRWEPVVQQLESGDFTQLRITESTLNAVSRGLFKPDPKTATESSGGILGVKLVPSPPNFRIGKESDFHISCGFNVTRVNRKVIMQTHGRFEPVGAGYRFAAEKMTIGSCPIPPIAGLPDLIFSMFATPFTEHSFFARMNATWRSVEELELTPEPRALLLRKPSA